MIKLKLLLSSIALLIPLCSMGQDLVVKSDDKGRLGYFDAQGNNVIKCQFEVAEEFVNGVARVRKDDDEWGLIDPSGKYIGDKYTVMEPYADTDLYLVAKGGSMKERKAIKTRVNIPAKIFLGSCEYPVDGGKWGLIDRMGNVVLNLQYDELSNPIDGVIYVVKSKKIGFLDKDMREVLKPTYTFMGTFNKHGLCWVMKGGKAVGGNVSGGKMGIMGRNGQLVVPVKYASVSTFAPATDSVLSSAQITSLALTPFSPLPDSDEPYLWYSSKKVEKPGILDIHGNVIIPDKKYDYVFKPTDGMVRFANVKNKKKQQYLWGFYNIEKNEEIFTDTTLVYYPFRAGSSLVASKSGDDFYVVDKEMKEISAHYDKSCGFAEGMCVMGNDGKWGAVNRQGKETVPLTYSNINPEFMHGVIGVENGSKDAWGVVDASNNMVIPFKYDGVGLHKNDPLINVKKDNKWGLVDRQDTEILPIKWLNFTYPVMGITDYVWVMEEDSLYYFYDLKAKDVMFPTAKMGYNEVRIFNPEGYAPVMKDSLYGAVYKSGEVMVPLQLEKLEDIDKAVMYKHKNNLTTFRDVDMRRFKIILRGKSNSYKLSDTIPDEEWDF